MAADAELKLDDVDHAILAELTSDGRQSVTAVAQKVHVSRAHAYSRIAKLQDAGVITRYTVVIDPVKTGLKASAYVTLRLRQHSWRELRDHLAAIPEVHHIGLVGGNFDVILLVRAKDNLDLRRVVFEELQALPTVIDTQTLLIFEDTDTR